MFADRPWFGNPIFSRYDHQHLMVQEVEMVVVEVVVVVVMVV